jgi:all-trans-8'-apo-beta-carotenal 15,15'-oxygenase
MQNAVSSAPLSARARSWNAGLAAAPGDLDLEIPASRIEGELPRALRGGRMLSNGPGWNVIDGVTLHPFDGHGYVRAFALREDGSVRLTARYVQTPSYRAEATAKRLVHRGFATNLDGPFWRNLSFGTPRNVANTTITRWNDRLLAGWEGGAPYALDARTLATRGEEHFNGAIAGQVTLAHFKRDAVNKRLVACSVKPGRATSFTFREIDHGDRVASTASAQVNGMLFTHDFALTPNWFVLGGNPLRVKFGELAKMLLGASTLLRAVDTDRDATPALHLVPRGGGAVRTVKLPDATWVVHFGNAFERDGDVIVDACVFHRFEFGEEFGYAGPRSPFDPTRPDVRGPQRLYRITVPAGAAEARWEKLTEHGVDFPRFHPEHEGRETPALFGATRRDTRFSDPFDSIVRVDLLDRARPPALWTAPEHTFVGEPVFVPAEGRDAEGHVLVIVTHGLEDRSSLCVFDAMAIERGPVATVPLPLLPIAFHGDWDGSTPDERRPD